MPAPRRAALVTSMVAGACLALAGCSGGSSSPGPSAAAGPNQPAAVNTSPAAVPPSVGKITGNFCTDFRSVADMARLPDNATGSVSELRKNGVPDLNKAATYFDGLAAEAPGNAKQQLQVIAADYRALAKSISSGGTSSLSKAVKQAEDLSTQGSSGAAFRQLISYMLTKCLAA